MNNLPPFTFPEVPILLYHHVADGPANYLTLDPAIFEVQMKYLYESGFQTISLYQLYSTYYLNLALPQKPVIITFDDGLIDQYTTALPILRRYHFTATFFIQTEAVEKREGTHMTWKQIAHMKQLGMCIEAHSLTHADLRTLSAEEQTREIYGSKMAIERKLSFPVKFFAYPGGLFDNSSLIIVRRSGFLGAVTGEPGKVAVGEDPFTLKRIVVGKTSFEEVIGS
ncbi:MAG TPA: polysaccharide deacetylase family protein [Candidatus Deferrimicrobium sp.]|nr:polysaccharide deacetylase family protein [Candidatus Deferrimicrobium sp.]